MYTEQLYRIFREESSGVSTDTRTLKKGQLFFALWGQNFNGNEYAAEALEKGASYAVIDDPAYESDRTILVDDCLIELQSLARKGRGQVPVVDRRVAGQTAVHLEQHVCEGRAVGGAPELEMQVGIREARIGAHDETEGAEVDRPAPS